MKREAMDHDTSSVPKPLGWLLYWTVLDKNQLILMVVVKRKAAFCHKSLVQDFLCLFPTKILGLNFQTERITANNSLNCIGDQILTQPAAVPHS